MLAFGTLDRSQRCTIKLGVQVSPPAAKAGVATPMDSFPSRELGTVFVSIADHALTTKAYPRRGRHIFVSGLIVEGCRIRGSSHDDPNIIRSEDRQRESEVKKVVRADVVMK